MNNQDVLLLLNETQIDIDNAHSICLSLGMTSNVVQYLNKYSIIKACGTIEVAYKSIISDYCIRRAKKQVKEFINQTIRESSSNPSYSNICSTLKKFDAAWHSKFKSKLDTHPEKSKIMSSLESLVEARNDFAHGGNPTLTITDINAYYKNSLKLIEILDEIIG
jgi:hypothetical protein